MIKNHRDVVACPVQAETQLSVGQPPAGAGGWQAVLSSEKFITREVGFWSGNRALLAMNQKAGFDCPGCAWPDPDHKRAMAEFCENGAKALAEEATRKRLGPEFFARYSVEELSRLSDYELGQAGRIDQPMVLRHGTSHYAPISWDEAFGLIADQLQHLASPDEAVFYTSGRTSNEAAYLYQLLVRCLGTNNLPDCSNLCHESSGMALKQSIGTGKGCVRLDDFAAADLILVIGQNPGTNHPRMLSSLRQAVKNGTRILSINPLFETGLKGFRHPQKMSDMLGSTPKLAEKNYAIRINGDLALFQGVAKAILDRHPDGLDTEFIAAKSCGFTDWRRHIEALAWADLERQSGLPRSEIHELAGYIMQAKSLISCWAMGLTQQPKAVATIRELTNLHLLGGFIGRPGSGLCPVRGHSNVQGDRTMGIYEKPSADFIERLEAAYDREFPRAAGHDVVDAIQAMLAGRCRFLLCMGGNFLSASPDTELTAEALKSLDLTVQISTKLNRSHLITGREALILPCLARSEVDIQAGKVQYITVENSMAYVHRSQGTRQPRSEHWRSEVAIVCGLAQRLWPESTIPWEDFSLSYDTVRDHIARTIPGFDNFNQKLAQESGFYLPNPPRDSQSFPTADGKAHFSIAQVTGRELEAGRFILMTVRSHDQYNTTIYGLDDRYRGIYNGRRVVFMNPLDMEKHGLMRNQSVDLCSYFAGQKRFGRDFRVIPFSIPQGCLAAYFPEANVLVPLDSYAAGSQTPTSKFIEVSFSSP
jgi:molybdopterin-dependent oxidoreductase alpha subunit